MATILERNKNIKTPKKTRQEHAEDALYREVWEEVNNEKTMRFLKQYGKYIAGAIIAILVVASAIQIGVRVHTSKKIAVANAYEVAISTMDANALASLANDTDGATADLALFQSYMIDKDIAKLEQLANSAKTPDFRDLARLHIIGIRGDKMTANDVQEYLSDLNTTDSPFYYTASLTIAQKYLSDGDTENANKWLDKILNDKNAPASISGTAQTLR